MAFEFINKKNKKIILGIIAIVVIIAAAIAGIKIYQNINKKIYSGDGTYYYQQATDKRLQFNKDNTFSYTVQTDESTADVSKGTWSQNNNEITLTYESGDAYTFVQTHDGFLYRKDKVFRGKTNDKKLWNRAFAYEEDGKVVERLWFMDDGTVDSENSEGKIVYSGTYTRTDNILTVRYNAIPDSYNKSPEIVERYLVLDNGITKELYAKTPAENVAK